ESRGVALVVERGVALIIGVRVALVVERGVALVLRAVGVPHVVILDHRVALIVAVGVAHVIVFGTRRTTRRRLDDDLLDLVAQRGQQVTRPLLLLLGEVRQRIIEFLTRDVRQVRVGLALLVLRLRLLLGLLRLARRD